jgi:arsenate reductase
MSAACVPLSARATRERSGRLFRRANPQQPRANVNESTHVRPGVVAPLAWTRRECHEQKSGLPEKKCFADVLSPIYRPRGRFLDQEVGFMGRFFQRARATPATTGDVVGLPGSSDRQTVLFVCLHGSAKSQMAAAHFNRMARDRGLPHTAISRAIEPDKDIPSSIRAGLAGEGLEPVSEVPASLTADEASRAMKVFAFNEVPLDRKGTAIVTLWSDVSPATEDYNRARDAIVRHVEAVLSDLASTAK